MAAGHRHKTSHAVVSALRPIPDFVNDTVAREHLMMIRQEAHRALRNKLASQTIQLDTSRSFTAWDRPSLSPTREFMDSPQGVSSSTYGNHRSDARMARTDPPQAPASRWSSPNRDVNHARVRRELTPSHYQRQPASDSHTPWSETACADWDVVEDCPSAEDDCI